MSDVFMCCQIEAEKLVLRANGKGGLATIALRPSGIFGEWDRLLVPVVVEKAKQGKMKYIIGSGGNKMEFTYAGNVALAHVLASPHMDAHHIATFRAENGNPKQWENMTCSHAMCDKCPCQRWLQMPWRGTCLMTCLMTC